MQFQFATASRIFFGEGSLKQVSGIALESGKKAFVVTGKGSAGPKKLFDELIRSEIKWKQYIVEGEPSTEILQDAVTEARQNHCDYVIGFGGGSVLDTAKAVSAMLTNEGDVLDYLEVVGKNLPINNPAAALIAIPTTAGTGTEVTRNAVLSVPDKKVKVSLRSYLIIPKYAVIDPELTYSMPPSVTASSGTDALTQVLEPYVSVRSSPMTDMFAKEGIQCASRSLRKAYQDGFDVEARRDMAWASLLGGLSLANAGLGAVHGFAGPFGGMFDAPHGAV
ncbi:MAG: iron-containing alcohol dehydrogenase, partial [Methanosarcinaceae archaeon]|nr:iron-containing alcohol dehydrogenase [Methanosarcinaceae archaeon]